MTNLFVAGNFEGPSPRARLSRKMAVIRTVHYYSSSRLLLFVLFFSVMTMSVVFTVFSLNESMEHGHHWQIVQQSKLDSSRRISSGLVSSNGFDNKISLSNLSPQHTMASFRPSSQRRASTLGKLQKLQRLKSKLVLKHSLGFHNNNANSKFGWKLLPGNTVVHDGVFNNPHDFSYIINPVTACKEYFNEHQLKIIIFVESDVRNADRRQEIRDTWALPVLQKALNFKVIFLLGAAKSQDAQEIVNEEFYAYGDVVQENFTENFKHLALKSVMGLKWVNNYCPEANFAMKTDDDILIHVPNLIKSLQHFRHMKNVLLCQKNRSLQIIRHGSAFIKYRVSTYELPGSFFPPYCGGFAYVMSQDAIAALYDAAIHTPLFFIEDVYITGFCRYKAKIEIVDHSNISLKPYLTVAQAPCSFAEGRITSQELFPDEMKAFWKSLNTRGFFCPVPVSIIENNATSFLNTLSHNIINKR